MLGELVRFVNSFIGTLELTRRGRVGAGIGTGFSSTLGVIVSLLDLGGSLKPGRVARDDLALSPLEEGHVCCFDLHGGSCLS